MISIIKNNFYRTLSKKSYIVVSIIMTAVSILLAVYFTSHAQIKGNIALVTNSSIKPITSKQINITVLRKAPPESALVLNKYDATVIDKGNGKYEIETIKSAKFKKTVMEALKNPKELKIKDDNQRGTGSTIIGYLLMFIMIQGILFMFTFAEDRECKQIRRISVSPLSFSKYLCAHFIFTMLFIFVPAYSLIIICKEILGFKVGFSLLEYLFILLIACSFSTAFSMFINSLTEVSDTANMTGSAIVTLTTILSGSFYSFDNSNGIFSKIIWILPQKNLLSFVQGMENKKAIFGILPQISYVVILTLGFFIFAIIKNRKDYIRHTE